MTDLAIRIENLGKRYRYGGAAPLSANLRADITDWVKGLLRRPDHRPQTSDPRPSKISEQSEVKSLETDTSSRLTHHSSLREIHERHLNEDPNYFWALKDINLEIKQGEVVGIIGRNGAGKSTLLKILSRITPPTTGKITYHGRIASLLEVGTGFHRELTGRENIYLNGSILGMKRAEITKNLDAIVAFAEVEKFIDTPVKFYSSGMYVRLAFAVAAHLEPEILVVDEVLAVGDASFQKKCLGKMGDVAKHGRTILFVSHNMTAVKNLCSRAFLLRSGEIIASGNVDHTISQYLRLDVPFGHLASIYRTGDGRMQFTAFHVEDENGKRADTIASGKPCTLVFTYKRNTEVEAKQVDVGFGLHDRTGERLLLLYASHVNQVFDRVSACGQFRCRLAGLPLATGQYSVFPRIEIDGVESDFPRDGLGCISVDECDYYGTGKTMGQHGHAYAPYIIKGEWSQQPICGPVNE